MYSRNMPRVYTASTQSSSLLPILCQVILPTRTQAQPRAPHRPCPANSTHNEPISPNLLTSITTTTTHRISATMPFLLELLSARYAPIQTNLLNHLAIREVLTLTYTYKAFGDLLPLLRRTD